MFSTYLYDHATWEQAEIYANYHLHSTTKLPLSEESVDSIHIEGINWNANLNNPLIVVPMLAVYWNGVLASRAENPHLFVCVRLTIIGTYKSIQWCRQMILYWSKTVLNVSCCEIP